MTRNNNSFFAVVYLNFNIYGTLLISRHDIGRRHVPESLFNKVAGLRSAKRGSGTPRTRASKGSFILLILVVKYFCSGFKRR